MAFRRILTSELTSFTQRRCLLKHFSIQQSCQRCRYFDTKSPATLLKSSIAPLPTPSPNLKVITSHEDFLSIISPLEASNSPLPLVVALYHANFSNLSQLSIPQFYSLASTRPSCWFLTVNVDESPRSAYHCEVASVPTIVIMYGDDAIRHSISPKDGADTQAFLQEAQAAIDSFQSQIVSGAPLRSKHTWYSHSIAIDNLNVHRVGWPVA